jgi:hypothetical protein
MISLPNVNLAMFSLVKVSLSIINLTFELVFLSLTYFRLV